MKMMNDFVLVEKTNETQTPSGLFIPDGAHVKHRRGTVYMDSKYLGLIEDRTKMKFKRFMDWHRDTKNNEHGIDARK